MPVPQGVDPLKDKLVVFSLRPDWYAKYLLRYGNSVVVRQSPHLVVWNEVTRLTLPEFAKLPFSQRLRVAIERGLKVKEVTIKLYECPNTNCREVDSITVTNPGTASMLVDTLRESKKYGKVGVLIKGEWRGEERVINEGMLNMIALLTGSEVTDTWRESLRSGRPTNYIPKTIIASAGSLTDEEINTLWQMYFRGKKPLSKETIEYIRRIGPEVERLDLSKATVARELLQEKPLSEKIEEVRKRLEAIALGGGSKATIEAKA